MYPVLKLHACMLCSSDDELSFEKLTLHASHGCWLVLMEWIQSLKCCSAELPSRPLALLCRTRSAIVVLLYRASPSAMIGASTLVDVAASCLRKKLATE
uniref:Uncharacterized protein n=1 Tax=Triticum urartu TaxID=4572 RepID=A0A8R7U4A9_TRIUA